MQKKSFIILRLLFVVISFLLLTTTSKAQELNAKIVIIRSQISNTTEAVFEALNNSLTAFMNEREWTEMEYEEVERINCTFNITLKTYSETDKWRWT